MVTAVNLAIQRVFWSTISKMVKQCRTWKNLYRAGRGSSKEQMVVDGKQSERLFDTGAEQSVLPQEYFGETRAQEYEEVWYNKQIDRDRSIRSNNEVDENNGWDIPAIHNYRITFDENGVRGTKDLYSGKKRIQGKTEEDELESEDGMCLITAEGLNEDDESETNNRAVDQQLKQIGDKWTSQAHELGWTDQVN
ncbi:hypothetical protein BLOT_000048 [Blomia tropicalis]|nr:hypothetical protein BLOT_000048 [Blomia tropicalis]